MTIYSNLVLPLDVWKNVSQFLPIDSIINLSLVNNIFHAVLSEFLKERRDDLTFFWESRDCVLRKKGKEKKASIAVLSFLRSVAIRYNKLNQEVMAGFIARSPDVEFLSLKRSGIKFCPIYNVLRDFRLLRSLDLSCAGISDRHLSDFAQFTSLTSLNLSENYNITGECFINLPTSLRVLVAATCSIDNSASFHLASFKLEEMNLARNRQIKDLSHLPTTLTSLNLSKTKINDESTIQLSKLTCLIFLDLSCNQSRILGSHYLDWPTSLTHLNIKKTYIDPDEKITIQSHFTGLKKLQYSLPEYWII